MISANGLYFRLDTETPIPYFVYFLFCFVFMNIGHKSLSTHMSAGRQVWYVYISAECIKVVFRAFFCMHKGNGHEMIDNHYFFILFPSFRRFWLYDSDLMLSSTFFEQPFFALTILLLPFEDWMLLVSIYLARRAILSVRRRKTRRKVNEKFIIDNVCIISTL